MQPDKKIVYELKGHSLQAAMTLHEKIRDELMPALYAPGKPGALKAFREQYKELIDITGGNSYAVKIHLVQGCYPRAYALTPEIFFHPGDNTRAYMYAPVDFKGRSFIPQDGIFLTEEDSKTISLGLWAGGWSDPEPVIQGMPPRGVQMPADFDPHDPAQNFSYADAPFDPQKAGRLMIALARSKAMYIAENAIIGVTDPAEFKFKLILVCEDNGRPGLLAKAMRVSDGSTLVMKPNAFFTPHAIGADGYYKLVPHPKTAGGSAFKSLFDDIPSMLPEDVWKACDASDIANFILPPPPPRALLHLQPQMPWPFPISAPAP